MTKSITIAALALASILGMPASTHASPTTVAPPRTIWITQVQVVWGPQWNANHGDTVNVLAYKSSPSDMGWVAWCNNAGGEPIVTTANVSQCESIDF